MVVVVVMVEVVAAAAAVLAANGEGSRVGGRRSLDTSYRDKCIAYCTSTEYTHIRPYVSTHRTRTSKTTRRR